MTHMERIGIREMRQHLSRDTRRVRDGESFVITDRGTEVARLVPAIGRATALDRLASSREVRRGYGDLLRVLDTLEAPIPGPPSGDVLDELRADLVSSALLFVEGQRAAARYGNRALTRARLALPTITLLSVDDDTLEIAAEIEPPELRSLDAPHLAAAVSPGPELRGFYCYDGRLAAGGAALGLDVRAPG